eukprot:scaffold698_cov397-Pinguiococcus_pyrenoidosus.AAC.5
MNRNRGPSGVVIFSVYFLVTAYGFYLVRCPERLPCSDGGTSSLSCSPLLLTFALMVPVHSSARATASEDA